MQLRVGVADETSTLFRELQCVEKREKKDDMFSSFPPRVSEQRASQSVSQSVAHRSRTNRDKTRVAMCV